MPHAHMAKCDGGRPQSIMAVSSASSSPASSPASRASASLRKMTSVLILPEVAELPDDLALGDLDLAPRYDLALRDDVGQTSRALRLPLGLIMGVTSKPLRLAVQQGRAATDALCLGPQEVLQGG